jgi:predicted RNase H-like nuclease (RuvC/YqgF family)
MIASGCLKEASDETLVREISLHGIPVLVAADTSPPSHFVRKVAARLNVKVHFPNESMTRFEKREISKSNSIDDPHIRDAYAAAVKAFRKFQNRLRQIDSMNVGNKEELKRMVIVGERLSDKLI